MLSRKRLAKFGLTPILAGLAAAGIIAVVLQPTSHPAEASSHREAPLIAGDPKADGTDLYAFIAPDAPDKVTFVANWIPFEDPAGGPNFYNFGDDVTYDIDIDNSGQARDDVVYRFTFKTEVVDPTTFLYATGPITSLNDPHFNIRQFYDVQMKSGNGGFHTIASHLAEPPNNVGPASTPNYTALASQAIYNLPGGGKVFAGQRDDPFFADLGAIFDLAQLRTLHGGQGQDFLRGFNVNSVVLQVPISSVTTCHCTAPAPAADADALATMHHKKPTPAPNLIIGVWSETYRNQTRVIRDNGTQSDRGPLQEVSRLGNPLVNEVVIPLAQKDHFNASEPRGDSQFLPAVLNSDLASKLNAVYGLGLPTTNRTDLATVFLTGIPGLNQPANVRGSEELRLNLGIAPSSCGAPSRLGVLGGDNCGFPNGRRLGDDVTDIALRAVACGYGFAFGPCDPTAAYAPTTQTLGDGVDGNDVAFLNSFPYVATPNSGFTHVLDANAGMPITIMAIGGFGAATVVLALLVVGGQFVTRAGKRRNKKLAIGD
jgi:hypothetical protein